jgi:hypothetical protein
MEYIQNKYAKTYFRIIDRAQYRILTGYTERHHIIPRSLGGTDDPTNIVVLSAREHYICHLLLTKMFSHDRDKAKMVSAAIWFRRHEGFINNRIYESLKTFISQYRSAQYTGKKLGPRPHAAVSQKAAWDRLTPEERALRTANYGHSLSSETKSKIGTANAAAWVKKRATGNMPIIDDEYRAKKRAAAQARWAKKS